MNYLYKGINISTFNSRIDFKELKEDGYNFVIIKAGYGKDYSQKDSKFEAYYKKAIEAGLDVGCYWSSCATTVDEAKEEAEIFLEVIKGKTFTYPCYYDVEDSKTSLKPNVSKAALTGIVNAWCKLVSDAGYTAGFYTFYSIMNRFNIDEIPYDKWLAKWSTSMNECSTDIWQMWQYGIVGTTNESTITGNVRGVDPYDAVDVNYVFKDYSKNTLKLAM